MIEPFTTYLDFVENDEACNATIPRLYGQADREKQRERLRRLLHRQGDRFGRSGLIVVSAPGRTELGGNHTDHNHGRVLAAAVDLDCLAAATPTGKSRITLCSEGFSSESVIDVDDIQPHADERGCPEALVRGVVAAFRRRGLQVGGFEACLHATCLPGTGLSSSAAFSVLIGAICNMLFNGNMLGPVDLALIAQSAENRYFGKPCGLMDQLASAAGHILHIDFNNPEKPEMEYVDNSSFAAEYCLAVVDTGGSHAALTAEYAAIPVEMMRAAEVLGRPFARGLGIADVHAAIPRLRRTAGDRAILRLIHFIRENERVEMMVRALRENRIDAYMRLVRASGDSSWRLLQNCVSLGSAAEQGVALALAVTENFLDDGAWRVHGGGFAGTIQVYVPRPRFPEYQRHMAGIFGEGSVIALHAGRPGVCAIMPDGRLLAAGQGG